MELAGFAVVEAATGTEGLDAVRTASPDVVLLDVRLPDVNGFELTRRLKTDPDTAAIPVIQISSHFVEPEYRVMGLESGADAYLMEPLARGELVWTLRAVLRSRDLERELRDLHRRKDAFMAMLVHELRQPLVPIDAALALLQRHVSSDAATRAHGVIARQTGHLSRLVDDLLDATRIARGKAELRSTLLDLREPVEESFHVVAPRVAERGVAFGFTLPPAPVWIRGDRQRLQQVFSNLLGNAIRHTPRDGRVDLALDTDETATTITVSDTGRGIPAELLPHVFELFVQGNESSSGSLGLGLAVVRGIVELHGGSVRAESDGFGCGSRFTVVLPRAERA